MKALRNTLAALLVLGAIVVLTTPATAGADIIQRPIFVPAYYSPPILPENPNPPDPGGSDLIMMTLVWLGLL